MEECLTLEYKGANALQKTDGKQKDITIDISAIANADGGILIYGISEYDEKDKRHLPEKLDAIDRKQYSKEWLEQVINNIRPRIEGLIIHPVDLDTGANDVAYVVEIPKGNTAHQAKDHRYYLRYNFQSVPMEDYQIRDVMHRGTKPDVSVKFMHKHLRHESDGQMHKYLQEIFVENHGTQVVNHFQVVFSTPDEIPTQDDINGVNHTDHITVTPRLDKGGFRISYRSVGVLFPEEELEIGTELNLQYKVDNEVYYKIKTQEPTLNWKLYADNMTPKHGQIPFSELNNF